MAKQSDCGKTYRDSLALDVRSRYDQKVSVIGLDPYEVASRDFEKDKTKWPEVNIVDVMHYLVFQQSAYSKEQLRNYKSLDAYRLFQDGWIRETLYKEINGHHLLRAKVTHSMAVRNKLLDCWVIVGQEGSIVSAHCTCMAGLGECCSHVAAVLFSLETWSRIRLEVSVTDVPAYWMFPTAANFDTPYKRLKEMDCTSATKKRKTLLSAKTTSETVPSNIPSPTKAEEENFLSGIQCDLNSAAVISLQDKLSDSFVPKSLVGNWPVYLPSLFEGQIDSNKEDISVLVDKCASLDITISQDQTVFVERETRGQMNSPFWDKYRTGRITASRFYAATHTNMNNPSVTLLKSICNGENRKVTTPAMEWGIRKESKAKQMYFNDMKTSHTNFTMEDSGLVLNVDYPEFGASPDGIVCCDCCGRGCLEVKCPYSVKDSGSIEVPWIVSGADNSRLLSRKHPYYYQVQMQMHLTDTEYCDFYVWSPHTFYYERVSKDNDLWEKESAVAKDFHAKCVMPELVFKCFTQRPILKPITTSGVNTGINNVERFCVCNGVDDGRRMINCDGENCKRQWFHTACIKMKRVPKGKWLCKDCK